MSEVQPTGTPKENLRALRIVFSAMLTGTLLFVFIVLFLSYMDPIISPVKEYENILAGISILAGGVSFAIANKGYSKGIAVAKDSLKSLPDKLNQYRATLIRYIALCEAPALFGVILFFVTGNYLMLIVTTLMVAAFLYRRPVVGRLKEELGLDWQQQQELE
jgi:uncharacterized integral membrane protein